MTILRSPRLRAALRTAARGGVMFLSTHPAIHRAVRRAYPLVPGLRHRLRSALVAGPATEAVATVATRAPYVFAALPPASEGPISVEGLNFLSRSL
jgi:hypothetical protein